MSRELWTQAQNSAVNKQSHENGSWIWTSKLLGHDNQCRTNARWLPHNKSLFCTRSSKHCCILSQQLTWRGNLEMIMRQLLSLPGRKQDHHTPEYLHQLNSRKKKLEVTAVFILISGLEFHSVHGCHSLYCPWSWCPSKNYFSKFNVFTKVLYKNIFVTLSYLFLKNYSTSASNILREAFYYHFLQTL